MSSEAPSTDAVAAQKPVISKEFPDPADADFDDDISEEEKKYYMTKFTDLNRIKAEKLHCTACDRHMGCAARNDGRMRSHPMLRTLVCRACHAFYNSGEFERGDDGSELYCRWCGQGGQVYCCSSCPIVFCAKCVKRNFSSAKMKEIESVDDWKCFKCASGVLWDLRATCWALLRYCDLKNKLAYITEDPELKEKYQKACLVDDSDCCKKRRTSMQSKKKDKLEEKKQEEKKQEEKKQEEKKQEEKKQEEKKQEEKKQEEKKPEEKKQPIILKRMPEIHIKKFAHQDACFNMIRINKRPGSPLYKKMTLANAPISIAPAAPNPFIMTNPPMVTIPQQKKIKLANIESLKAPPSPIITKTYSQRKIQKPKAMLNNTFNGFPTQSSFATLSNDTINLSLDSLTQGLDIAAVSAYNEAHSQTDEPMNMNEDDVVCTPDFPLEPLCEVTEDNNDDDVECMTPGPLLVPRPMASMAATSTSVASTSTAKMPPPLVPRISQDDIVQMTDNDVTINKSTGGLKFRVDPQTLSANKMYRLPDGRVFAINANPSMPGGYSATIVAVAETTSGMRNMPPPGRVTYAAKLSTVIPATPPPPLPPLRPNTRSSTNTTPKTVQTSTSKVKRAQKTKRKTATEKVVDMKTPVEWYRYNLVDAEDLMSYVLKRLNKLKETAEVSSLRKKDVNEMKMMHKNFDQLLRTSITRFTEVKESLNQGYKEWSKAKSGKEAVSDDDVEILGDETHTEKPINNSADSDDPIFIDENSNDSVKITSDEMSNDNEAINSQTIIISDRTDNINQDTIPILSGTSRSFDIQDSPRRQETETSSVLNISGEELATEERMDTVFEKDYIMSSASTDAEVKDSVTVELDNDPKLDSANGSENTDVQVNPAENTDVQVNPAENIVVQVPPAENTDVQVNPAENTDVQVNPAENTDVQVNPPESTDVQVKSAENTDVQVNPPESTDVQVKSAENTDVQVNSGENTDVQVNPAENTVIQVNPAESTDVQVNSAANTDVQVDPAKTEEDTKLGSPVNSEIPKNNSIPSSPIPDGATKSSAISKSDTIDHEIAKGESLEAQTMKDDATSSETSDVNNKEMPSSQIEICATSQESVLKVNGDNAEAIDICPKIEDNNQVDTTLYGDKNKVSKDKTVSQTTEDNSKISDNGDKKGVVEVDCGNNFEDKLSPTQGSEGNEINNSKIVTSEIMDILDDEPLGETVTSKSDNVNELKSTPDTASKEVKSKAAQDLEMAHQEASIDKMDIDLDLDEEELLNGDKMDKGDGDRDDVAISDDLINDLLDDNLGPGGEDKIPNLNIPCQP